ncbi:MAG: nucleotide sugar dehydrogenase [Syntrophales bacterium]
MNISIFGMGYVGTVSGVCFSKMGHKVIGVDVNPMKVELINQGRSPIVEKGIAEMLGEAVSNHQFSAVTSSKEAVIQTDMSFVCVGTPSNGNGTQNLSYVKNVCLEIGESLKEKAGFHTVVIRSTLIPGTVENTVIPYLEKKSGKKAGVDFAVFFNPEFMREGSSVHDFFHPPMTVIGGPDDSSAEAVAGLYEASAAPLVKTSYRVAEAIKYVCNVFHALKIVFANEIGTICKALEIDSHEVMEIFCLDSKLNISRAYLRPGFAFGGSCLPKDLRALTHKAKEMDLIVPLLNSILYANQAHIERTLEVLYRFKKKKIGLIGLSFKPGTDDLRESPLVTLAETLIGKGFQIRIFDRNIFLAMLTGSNREFIENEIPHIASILADNLDEIIENSEVIVVGNNEDGLRDKLERTHAGQVVVDLARVFDKSTIRRARFTYYGICW